MAAKNVHGHCSVPWSIISYHLERNSVPSPLASCELVARPGGGFRQPLPVASPSKALLHEEREGDSGHVKFLLVLAPSYRRGSLGQHFICVACRGPPGPLPITSLHRPCCLAHKSRSVLHSFFLQVMPPRRSCQRAEGHRGQAEAWGQQ